MKEILGEIKIIWSYLRPYKKQVYSASALALVSVLIGAVVPYLYGKLVDLVGEPSTEGLLINILIVWFLMSGVSAYSGWVAGKKSSFLSIDIYSDFITKAASHLINLPLTFHKEKKTGEIFSKIDRAADYLNRIIGEILVWFFPQLVSAFIGVLILFFVQTKLALGAGILFLSFVLITLQKTGPIVKGQEKLSQTFEEGFSNLYDSFENVQTIKSFSAEEFQAEKSEKDFRGKLSPVFKNYMNLWHSLTFWQNLSFSLGFVAVFGYAIFLLKGGIITPGKLVMFVGYLNLIYSPLTMLAWYWQQFRTGMAAIKRAEKFLEIEEENFNEEGRVLKEIKGKVEFKNVSFGYQDHKLVLGKINLLAQPGQKIALVGGSGEGKTTLADLISLYFKPLSGRIFIDDTSIEELNLHFLRKIIASVPQEITLFNDTVKNNIRYGKPEASEEEIKKAARAANAADFIDNFSQKYETVVGERGVKLSTGQKQRIAIARALISDPRILILDEATSSLDSESEKLVQEALEKLIKDRTTFIIAHRLSTIRKADQIMVLEKGRIAESGTHEELLAKKGLYHKFYSLQFQPSH